MIKKIEKKVFLLVIFNLLNKEYSLSENANANKNKILRVNGKTLLTCAITGNSKAVIMKVMKRNKMNFSNFVFSLFFTIITKMYKENMKSKVSITFRDSKNSFKVMKMLIILNFVLPKF